LHSYLNLAEATKIRLHAEFNTLSIMAGCFRFVKEENTMTWRIVHVCQSEKMQLKLDNLLIKKMGQDYVIPLSDISIIVAEGGETVVTLRLLSALSKYNIALIVCDNEHLPTGIYHSQNGHFRAYKKLFEITKDDKYLKIPAIIKKDDEITEDMAKEIIIDTNWIQRQLSTYEKTQSILQKYVKIKQSKNKGTKTRDVIASHLGITGRMVQNYISLNNLNTGFFEMLDDNLINIKQAIIIAKFDDYIQEEILKHKDKISFNIQLLKSALSIKNKDRVIEILSANNGLDEEENYIKVVYKIPKDKKSEFDKIYKDFIKNL